MIGQDQQIFNILLETVSQAVIIVDENQNIMEINGAAETVFGYSKEEIKDKHLDLLIPSNYHKKYKAYVKSLIKAYEHRKMAKTTDVYGLKKSGDIILVEVELNPFIVYDKTYVMALVRDVSKQKENEYDFMLRNKALESATNGILITDAQKPDNPVIYVNPAFEKLTGYSKEDALNKNCSFLQANDREQEEIVKIRKAIKAGESCLVTMRNYKKDGTLFWNDLYITPITNRRGVVTNFIGIQNDVTERVRAEEERNHLATIFNESLNEIYVFDAENLKFVSANRGALENIGYTIEELKSMTPLELKDGIDDSSFRLNYIQPLLEKKIERVEFEIQQKRKDGTTYPVNVYLQLSKLNQRPVFVAIIVDITEHKNYLNTLEKKVIERTEQLEVALRKEKEINELKTKFLSLVSHEFKTPLSGISTSTMLLEKYKKTDEQDKRNRHIDIIKDKVNYLNNILNDFLSIDALDSGVVNYKFNNFRLSKVINEVIYNANMSLKEGQHINYPENIDDMEMYQNERVVQLILANIVQNAIKYSNENSEIDIHISQDKNFTHIKVKDYGIGVPKKDLANIFDRYFRAENVLNMQGTGIGLNISKTHAENLGGKILLSSEEHKGTTVILTIPTYHHD
ncbi:MAG: PAS domain S-box protein [Winogradskyella sp.]|uniref:PAS domain-containing sensor histidine kinase n=1 Tax=Winogradskyella sp. TaxID=1883156 RepID=UPI00182EC1D5|nr:PAS domain S-box protein [Winogradskyella sp.]MBT8245856.1 PAS domain S-box protein [Winogradskyella sp.]NNK23073.1 PAS domain S-box protein [Winogradskyella sp.]